MAPPRSPPERKPENPRRFHFHRCLGRGGFGEVYRATMWRDGGVTTEVAVKVLATDLDPNSDAVRRLTDEGRLLGALNHPGIVKVYDLVLLAGRVALVTEYIEGQDLHAVLYDPADPFPRRALVESIGRVAEALHAAWTTPSPSGGGPMHLVHRDVKPQNIRLGIHGEVKLLDFGIARAANVERESNTQTNLLMGSWPYLAPERLLDEEAEPGPEIDVYGLGCTLYEGLGGQRLLEGYKLLDLYRFVEEEGGVQSVVDARLAELTARAPPGLLKLLARMLSSDPIDRPAPFELAQRCEDLAERMPGANLRRWARDRRWPDPDTTDGPLTDMDLMEGTLDIPKRRPPSSPPAGPTISPSSARAPKPSLPPAEEGIDEAPVERPPPPGAVRSVVPKGIEEVTDRMVDPFEGLQVEGTDGLGLENNYIIEPTESEYDEPTDRHYTPRRGSKEPPPLATPVPSPRRATPVPAALRTRAATPPPAVSREAGPTEIRPTRSAPEPADRGSAGPTEIRPTLGGSGPVDPAGPTRLQPIRTEREPANHTPATAPARGSSGPTLVRGRKRRDDPTSETPPTARPRGSEPRVPVEIQSSSEPALPDLLAIKIDEREPAESEPRRGRSGAAFGAGIVMLVFGLGLLAIALTSAVALGIYWYQSRPDVVVAPPVPGTPEPVAPAPDPVAPEPAEPEPAQPDPAQPDPVAPEPAQPDPAQPEPAPAAPAPTAPDPRPARPDPAPAQPEPAQPDPAQPEPAQPEPAQPEPAQPEPVQPEPVEPEPAPSTDSFARMIVEGDATVELHGDYGEFRAGTPLPPGGYAVWADFGDGMADTGVRTIATAAGLVTVNCSVARRECLVTP